MSQPDPDPDRYKSRGRKERTPAQLAVLAQAREKAKIVIALLPFVESVDLSTNR